MSAFSAQLTASRNLIVAEPRFGYSGVHTNCFRLTSQYQVIDRFDSGRASNQGHEQLDCSRHINTGFLMTISKTQRVARWDRRHGVAVVRV